MFQSFSAKALVFEHPHSPPARPLDEARELISRYPNLSEVELARLINMYREMSALDTALMLSDESLTPKLDRFSADHRKQIRTPFYHYAALLLYVVLGIAALTWALASAA